MTEDSSAVEDDEVVDVDQIDVHDDAEVPEELQFSTGGDDAEREFITIKIDGMDCRLYRPSDATLLLSTNAWSEQVSDIERSNAIMTLINVCLDEKGKRHLRSQMLAAAVNFDMTILAKLLDLILSRWGNDVVPQKNREQRRAAARKGKKK